MGGNDPYQRFQPSQRPPSFSDQQQPSIGPPLNLLSLLGISGPTMPTADPAQTQQSPGVPPGITPPFLGVGVYRGRGPGGPGSDYYGWPDLIGESHTAFPPPEHFFGAPTKVL